MQIHSCFSVESEKSKQKKHQQRVELQPRKYSKELKGKVRALIWFMECNMIYIQKNILF